jgi:hypothetical protein
MIGLVGLELSDEEDVADGFSLITGVARFGGLERRDGEDELTGGVPVQGDQGEMSPDHVSVDMDNELKLLDDKEFGEDGFDTGDPSGVCGRGSR